MTRTTVNRPAVLRLGATVAPGLALLALALALVVVGCTGPQPVEDPMGSLARTQDGPRKHLGAMQQLDAAPDAPSPEYLEMLRDILWRPGYVQSTRQEAFDRLERYDLEDLKREIRLQLPNMSPRNWQEHLCRAIADRGWYDLSPAIVSAWARPMNFVDDLQRVEFKALLQMYGSEADVIEAVFELLVESRSPTLRTRCWQLLFRLGHQERIVELLAEGQVPPDDAMLIDLQAAARDLGVVPRNREEILWVRKLRDPDRAAFWAQASQVVQELPAWRRRELELRDLPLVVAASIHDPWLFEADKDQLYDYVHEHLRGQKLHVNEDRFRGIPGSYDQHLVDHRTKLTWGDLAAMVLAVRAVDVPEVVAHLFDFAERDLKDTSTEFGGVIRLDSKGRFEVLEFVPRFRRSDQEFIASQQMLDAAYTAVFHFHLHAQRYDNRRYAGPGLGDVNYADNLRANCLVFTFIDRDRMNVDYYRYDRVIVDLGEIHRADR